MTRPPKVLRSRRFTGEAETGGAGSAEDFGDLLIARVSAESNAKLGQRMRLALDASKIHLFDPETEKAIT